VISAIEILVNGFSSIRDNSASCSHLRVRLTLKSVESFVDISILSVNLFTDLKNSLEEHD
jgi:hypothetical protein